MAKYQVSPNLIDQVQILLRKEAHLESFNPNDPSLPSPPTLNEAVAAIEPEGDRLRCKHCSGALLRGFESIICVYCGHCPQHEQHPQPIGFKSTLGFGLLLQSLKLDASESVEPPAGNTQSNGGRSSPKDGISLSDLLDLELKWPEESKGLILTSEAQLPGKRYLNLVGVDVDDLFPEGSTELTSYKHGEQTSDNIEIRGTTTFPAQSFFEKTQSSEAGLRSDKGEHDQSSCWEAEFQSAIPDTEHDHLQASDVSRDSPVDYASPVDSVIRLAEHEKSSNFSSSDAPSRSNLTYSDLHSNSVPPFHPKQYEQNILVRDIEKVSESVDTSSNFDWSLNDQQKPTGTDLPQDEKNDDYDSFNDWNEFTVSTVSENNQSEPSNKPLHDTDGSGGLDISDAWNDFTTVGVENNQLQTSTLKVPDDDSLGTWNEFTTSSKTEDIQFETRSVDICQQEKHYGMHDPTLEKNDFALLEGSHQDQSNMKKTSTQADPIGLWNIDVSAPLQDDQLQGRGTKSPASGTTREGNDSYDFWNDFKSPADEKTQEANNIRLADNKISSEGDSTIDAWNDFASLGGRNNEQRISSAKTVDSNRNGSHVDSNTLWNDNSLDDWNDFTTSTGVSNSEPTGNDNSFGEWNDFSSTTVIRADQHQSSDMKGAENLTVVEDDDSFSSWSDFTSSGRQIENRYSTPDVTESKDHQISMGKAAENDTIVKENSPFNSWGEFEHSTPTLEMQPQASGAQQSDYKLTSGGHDFFHGWSDSGDKSSDPSDNQLNSNGATAQDDKSKSENDDSFDVWTDFTSSSNVQANSSISTSTKNAPENKEAVEHDDPFDTWDVFVCSPNVDAGNEATQGKEITSERNLSNTNTNSHGVGPSSVHPDLLLGAFSDQIRSPQEAVSRPEVPDLFRMENGDAKAIGYSEQTNRSESASKETLESKSSDVETLISEMHDLSFMLESSLSIPKNNTP